MSVTDQEQVTIRMSDEFRGFFRKLIANEQLHNPGRRITNKSIMEKALLQYARRTYPKLTPKELYQ